MISTVLNTNFENHLSEFIENFEHKQCLLQNNLKWIRILATLLRVSPSTLWKDKLPL